MVHGTPEDAALLEAGYASAKQTTLAHARSFSLASVVLFGARRRAAFAVYAFCRRLDDLVDDGEAEPASLPARLERARGVVTEVFAQPRRRAADWERAAAGSAWPQGELAAFGDSVHRFGLEEGPFQELVLGMEMDLTKRRYASWSELDLYCYRVAGTVGLMMAPLLGCSERWALGPAVDLGKAMQLTNVLRDVREDFARGRVYLPADELAACGVGEAQLARGEVTEGWRHLVRLQLQRARALYASAARGFPALSPLGPRALARIMAALYGGILDEIERADFDVFSRRRFVPGPRKARLAVTALFGARPGGRLALAPGRPSAPALPPAEAGPERP